MNGLILWINSIICSCFLTKIISFFLWVIKFRSGNIKPNIYSTFMSWVFKSFLNNFQAVVFISNLRSSKSSFISNICSTKSEHFFQKFLKRCINFTAKSHRFFEWISSCWKNHKFLHFKTISSMCSSINDIKRWDWHNKFICWFSCKYCNILI